MRTKENYIKSPKHWKDMYAKASSNDGWKPIDKISIKKIRFKKSLLAYPNKVDLRQVDEMVNNF